MTIVLDASVALKLVSSEPGTAEAQALLERDEERIAPDWMLTEVASSLANKVRSEQLDLAKARASFAALPSFIDRFVASGPTMGRAIDLAAKLDHALYDCVYLLIAIEENGVVVTADDDMVSAARRGGYTDRVERLLWKR